MPLCSPSTRAWLIAARACIIAVVITIDGVFSSTSWTKNNISKKKGNLSRFKKLTQRYKATRDVTLPERKATPAPSTFSHKKSIFSSLILRLFYFRFREDYVCYCARLDVIQRRKSVPFEWCMTYGIRMGMFWETLILKVRNVWSKNGLRKVWVHPSYKNVSQSLRTSKIDTSRIQTDQTQPTPACLWTLWSSFI